MIQSTIDAERVRATFEPSPRGVVGLVDDLLALCRVEPLRFDFRDGQCSIRLLAVPAQESIEISLPKSVFRAMLARIAVLCNERRPASVTPYRGDGELSLPGNSAVALSVSFANRPGEQRLEISRLPIMLDSLREATAIEDRVSEVASGIDTPAY